MKKKTIVYIAPHLSTGGMPQYLVKQIETIKEDVEVYCIEWDNVTGGVLVVQRNKMVNLLGDRLITLGEPREHLFTLLDRINPDVVHLQEIPELFMPSNIAERLYNSNRAYVIIETSHDSSYNVQNKMFLPDKFLMVSQYQIDQYKALDIPIDLVEYPIENKIRTKTREQALRDLGLDPNLKHVINVGLFTPRKNQAEVIEYARQLRHYPIQFHFIGNQADNFKHYWEPLMQNFPSNCKWWNERSDVDNFYEAADLFLFTSRGNDHDKETMPLVIREALSWKTPSMIYNLPVYMGYFDKYETIEYLSENTQQNAYRIAEKLLRGTASLYKPTQSVDEYFDFAYEHGENKIHMYYKKQTPFRTKVSCKDKDSNAPIYWMDMEFGEGSSVWMIPTPTHICNFDTDPSFSTLLIEFYDPDTNELQFAKELFIKEATKKRTVHLDIKNPFDCLFNNYNEMFVERHYDCYGLRNLDVVLDIGANSGLFSLLMLHEGAKKVYAFEPNQTSLINLKHMFRDTDSVSVIEKAVYTDDKDLEFFIDPSNTTIGSLLESRFDTERNTPEKITVPAISLKTFVRENNINKISLVKIDIEGAEYELMDKLEDEVYNIVDKFLIEFHNNIDKRVVKLTDKLKEKGYDIVQIRNQSAKNNDLIIDTYETSPVGTLLAEKRSAELSHNPILIVDAFFHNNNCVETFKQYLTSVKKLGIPIMLVTNSKFDTSLVDKVDYILYDVNNRLFQNNYKDVGGVVFYTLNSKFYISSGEAARQIHGLSVLSNLYHSTNLAKTLGYTHFYRLEYDSQVGNIDNVKRMMGEIKDTGKKGIIYLYGNAVPFQIWYFELEYFTKHFPKINNEKDYIASLRKFNSKKDFLIVEDFMYELIASSEGGLSNLIVRPAPDMHTDFGNSKWNTITSPAESRKLVDGCLSTLCKVTITNDEIKKMIDVPRPEWHINPEACDIDISKIVFLTWNCASDVKNHSIAKITYPNGTTSLYEHNIDNANTFQTSIIDVVDGDMKVEIILNGTTHNEFIINKSMLHELSDVYQTIEP